MTIEFYTDRILGVSDVKTIPVHTVQAFTGNNIAPRGDLASRTLVARLTVDRPDPENRVFQHLDPVGWTDAHRGSILRAAYTILLGNPRLGAAAENPPATTRFKIWWEIVGSAIEHAAGLAAETQAGTDPGAKCLAQEISFKDLFLTVE